MESFLMQLYLTTYSNYFLVRFVTTFQNVSCRFVAEAWIKPSHQYLTLSSSCLQEIHSSCPLHYRVAHSSPISRDPAGENLSLTLEHEMLSPPRSETPHPNKGKVNVLKSTCISIVLRLHYIFEGSTLI